MALWTPAYINTALWLDASDASARVVEAGAVAQLTDKSGNGFDMIAPSGREPVLVAEEINGLDVCRFNGTSHALVGDGALFSDHMTVLIVFKRTATFGVSNLIFAQGASGITNRMSVGGSSSERNTFRLFKHAESGNTSVESSEDLAASFDLLEVRKSGTAVSLYSNGVAAGSGALATASIAAQNLVLGGWDSGTGAHCAGDIGEIVAFTSVPDAATLLALQGCFAHKWGQASKLAADHPFKSGAPRVFSGTVRDKSGTLVARTVTAIRESDQTVSGTTVSDATTGEYQIVIPYSDAHTLVFSGESDRNALVYSGVVP